MQASFPHEQVQKPSEHSLVHPHLIVEPFFMAIDQLLHPSISCESRGVPACFSEARCIYPHAFDRSIQKNECCNSYKMNECCNSYKMNDVKLLFQHHISVSEQWCMHVCIAS